jgi:AraC-like DNA-binding protein
MPDRPDSNPHPQTQQQDRQRHRLHRRIRNIRQHNRHLTIMEIAAHAGVSVAYVKNVLELPAGFPNN